MDDLMKSVVYKIMYEVNDHKPQFGKTEEKGHDIVFWVLNQSGVKLKLKLSTCFGGQAT